MEVTKTKLVLGIALLLCFAACAGAFNGVFMIYALLLVVLNFQLLKILCSHDKTLISSSYKRKKKASSINLFLVNRCFRVFQVSLVFNAYVYLQSQGVFPLKAIR